MKKLTISIFATSLLIGCSGPVEPVATPEEFQEFKDYVKGVDPDGQAIFQVTQFEGTGTLTLTVGPEFLASDKVSQGNAAVGLRNKWAEVCDCAAVLSFQTDAGLELIHIGWDQPKFRQ